MGSVALGGGRTPSPPPSPPGEGGLLGSVGWWGGEGVGGGGGGRGRRGGMEVWFGGYLIAVRGDGLFAFWNDGAEKVGGLLDEVPGEGGFTKVAGFEGIKLAGEPFGHEGGEGGVARTPGVGDAGCWNV